MSKAKSRQCTALGLRLGVPKVDVIGYVFRVCAVARGTWAGPGVNEGPIQSNRTRPAVRAVRWAAAPRGARVCRPIATSTPVLIHGFLVSRSSGFISAWRTGKRAQHAHRRAPSTF